MKPLGQQAGCNRFPREQEQAKQLSSNTILKVVIEQFQSIQTVKLPTSQPA